MERDREKERGNKKGIEIDGTKMDRERCNKKCTVRERKRERERERARERES